MTRFAPALRSIARELDLPPRVKAAVLLEMAGDLEAAFDHHRELGIAEEEADRLAEEAVLGSAEVVRRLVGLHRQSWLGWSERVGQRLSGGAGRHLPVLLTLSAAAPALGLLAAALEIRSAAAAFAGGIPEVAVQVALVEGIGSAGALLLAGLLAGLAGALSWFVLLNRDAVRVRREVDAILDDPGQGRSRVRRSSDHRTDAVSDFRCVVVGPESVA